MLFTKDKKRAEEKGTLKELARALRKSRLPTGDETSKKAVGALLDLMKCAASVQEIKFARTPLAKDLPPPALAHPREDIGFDLRTAVDFTILPGEVKEVPTGLIFDLPVNDGLFRLELKIEQRTGNGGRGLFAAAKTVDAGYRPDPNDENGLVLRLRNVGTEELSFSRGDAVAQGIFAIKVAPNLKEVTTDQINYNTERGAKRFGATGR